MMEAKSYAKPGDENSLFYTKPDEPPVSHPAEVLERLKKEKPDTSMEDLVKEADAVVASEMEERRKWREEQAKKEEAEEASSTEAKVEEAKDEGEPEVSSA
jgi:hypothetical protein